MDIVDIVAVPNFPWPNRHRASIGHSTVLLECLEILEALADIVVDSELLVTRLNLWHVTHTQGAHQFIDRTVSCVEAVGIHAYRDRIALVSTHNAFEMTVVQM